MYHLTLGTDHPEMKLIVLCLTRWIDYIDSIHRFREVFPVILKTYEIIKTNIDESWNHDTCMDVQGLFHACTNFEFVMLVIVERVFALLSQYNCHVTGPPDRLIDRL